MMTESMSERKSYNSILIKKQFDELCAKTEYEIAA